MIQRKSLQTVMSRIEEPRRFIQVLIGPRQTGKTTIARQLQATPGCVCNYATADEPVLKDSSWIEQQWERSRRQLAESDSTASHVLILDEVQKLTGWSETVKRLWDEDTYVGRPLKVVLLGSSALLVQRGLAESLAGRFEMIRVTHWSYAEMREAFGWSVDQYIYYGGYPGAAAFVPDYERWIQYVNDSLIEMSVSRDVLLMAPVEKPALLRRLFQLACIYSGQVLSYQKMLGQLQDAGSTTTLAHYLDLLASAGLVMGLQKYAGEAVRRRGSSPKLLALNTGLISATGGMDFARVRDTPDQWGRLVESAVGATLANGVLGKQIELYYWLSRNREVDFVLRRGPDLVAIEVKSGRKSTALPGIAQFRAEFPTAKPMLVGTGGIPLEEFFLTPVESWLS